MYLTEKIFRSSLMALTVLFTVLALEYAHAQYKDIIEMPAIKIEAARYSLILDIAKAGKRLVAVGEWGHVLYSDDQGNSWTQADVDTRSQLNAVCFVDDTRGWAVGEDAVIVHTTDGGETWRHRFDDRDADTKGPLLDVAFLNDKEGIAVGVYNKIVKTTDGGASWQDWSDHVDNLDEWHLFNLAVTESGAMYIGSEQGLVFKSEDHGERFVPIQTDHIGSFPGLIVRKGNDGQDRVVAFGPGGAIWTSADGGIRWRELDSGTLSGLLGGTWMADGSAVIVGHEGAVLLVNPALENVSYHPQENGLPFGAVEPVNGNGLALVGFGGPQVIKIPKATQ